MSELHRVLGPRKINGAAGAIPPLPDRVVTVRTRRYFVSDKMGPGAHADAAAPLVHRRALRDAASCGMVLISGNGGDADNGGQAQDAARVWSR